MLAEARAREDEVEEDPAVDLHDGADNVLAGACAPADDLEEDSSVELGEFAS